MHALSEAIALCIIHEHTGKAIAICIINRSSFHF
jgi:hypothetical protein